MSPDSFVTLVHNYKWTVVTEVLMEIYYSYLIIIIHNKYYATDTCPFSDSSNLI